MGSDDDSTMVGSSIALLQERFRQLERVREKREEKEQVLKLVSYNNTDHHQAAAPPANKPSFRPEISLPPPPQDYYSLSLGLHSQQGNKQQQADFLAKTSPTLTSLWPNNNGAPTPSSTFRNFDHSDVDTSLHL